MIPHADKCHFNDSSWSSRQPHKCGLSVYEGSSAKNIELVSCPNCVALVNGPDYVTEAMKKLPDWDCSKCGQPTPNINYVHRKRLDELQLCFSCNYKAQRRAVHAVVDSQFFSFRAGVRTDVSSHCLGFGGRRYKFRMNDGRELESNDVWTAGTIPPEWRDDMPDNAVIMENNSGD